MSKISRKPIIIPEEVKIKKKQDKIIISGPKGEVTQIIPQQIEVKIEDGKIQIIPKKIDSQTKSLWGTIWSLLRNAVEGVSKGWQKKLQIVGTGYRAKIQDGKLVLTIGFSHNVVFTPPAGITFLTQEDKIIIQGADKQLVGEEAAKIRKARLPDAYHGKGIRYEGEVIKLKPGKVVKTTEI